MLRNILLSRIENIENVAFRYRLSDFNGIAGTVVKKFETFLVVVYIYSSKLLQTISEEFSTLDDALSFYDIHLVYAESQLSTLRALRNLVADELVNCTRSTEFVDTIWCTNSETLETIAVSFNTPAPEWLDCSKSSRAKLFFLPNKLLV